MPKVVGYALAGMAMGAAMSEMMKPDTPELPEPPKVTDPEVRARKKTQKQVLAAKQGFQDTILTGPLGTNGGPTLLG